MSELLTLDGLSAPMRALRLLAVDFGHLPAPAVDMSGIFAERLYLSLHTSDLTGVSALAAFEMWRDALGIDPHTVTIAERSGGRTCVLRAETLFGGAEIVLRAYADTPAGPDSEPGGAA
ncbi:hypothetical protein [Streptomyces niveus]|uniref:hypothetical protein n=1 Tax=Streptomyces niveus TaxID=193462 RepID=UPI003430AE6C